jgi:hypothetical protein
VIEVRLNGYRIRWRRMVLLFAATAALWGAAEYARGYPTAAGRLWEMSGSLTLLLAVLHIVAPILWIAGEELKRLGDADA